MCLYEKIKISTTLNGLLCFVCRWEKVFKLLYLAIIMAMAKHILGALLNFG